MIRGFRLQQRVYQRSLFNVVVLLLAFGCAIAMVGLYAQTSFADKDTLESEPASNTSESIQTQDDLEHIDTSTAAKEVAENSLPAPKVQEAPMSLPQPLNLDRSNSGPSPLSAGTLRSGGTRNNGFQFDPTAESFEEKTEIRYGRDANGTLLASKNGQFAHHKYKITNEAGVMVKQLHYVADQSKFGYIFVEEMRPELGFKLGKPGTDWYIDSSQLNNRGGTGAGAPSLFEWRGYTILLRGDMKNIYLEFPRPIPLPAGSEIEFIYTGNHYGKDNPPGVGGQPPSANGGLKVPNIPDNYVIEPLQSPPDLASCSVSTIYNGSGGNKTPTTLSQQRLGSSDFTNQTTNGWKYNAMAYHPTNGHIYAVSQTLDAQHPGGHLLAIDPTTGQAQNLGEIEGMLDGREYEYITQYPRPFVPEKKETRKEKDDKNLISTGFFTPNGEYWIANASTSGSGYMYKVDLDTAIAERVTLSRGTSYLSSIPNPAGRDARPNSNDYTFLPDAPNYAWGMVNQLPKANSVSEPYLERIDLRQELDTNGKPTGKIKGVIDHFPLKDLVSITGESMHTATTGTVIYGASWTYGNGTLGFDENNGRGAYQLKVENPESPTPKITLQGRTSAPSGYNNDGTSCIAAVKPDLSINKKRIDKDTSALKDKDVDVVWTITVTNNGTGDSGGYRIDDVLPEKNYTNIEVAVGVGTFCTLRPGTDTEPAAMQCYGDELEEGKSRTITLGAKYNTDSECMDNTATVEGVDGEYDGTDGEHPDTTGNNTSTAVCESPQLAIAKTPAADQDPDKDGNQLKVPLVIDEGANPKTASGTAHYNITITNNTKTAVKLPQDGIKDTLHLPSWIDLGEVTMKVGSVTGSVQNTATAPAITIESGAAVSFTPSAETPSYEKGKPYTLDITEIGGAPLDKISMAGESVLVLSVEVAIMAPLKDFTHKDHAADLTCVASTPANTENTNGFFNGVFLQDETDPLGTTNNYACVEPDLPNTAVSVKKDRPPGGPTIVETDNDDSALLTYRLTITNPSDSPNRVDGIFDKFTPPTGVSIDTSAGKVVTFTPVETVSDIALTWAVTLDPTAHTVPADTFEESMKSTTGFKVLDVIEMPATTFQSIDVSIPVKVDWSVADKQSLGTCTQSTNGTFTGGVQNTVALPEGIVDKDSDSATPPVTNNVACIPLRQRPNLAITLTKFAYENGEFSTTPLSGAEFAIMQLNGTTYSPVTTFRPSGGNTGTYTADLNRDGTYYLVETKAPEGGYSLLPRAIAFNIVRTDGNYIFSLVDADNDSVLINSEMPENDLGNQLVLKVADVKTGELPHTGLSDQRPWIVLTVLIIVAMCGLNYQRRPRKT